MKNNTGIIPSITTAIFFLFLTSGCSSFPISDHCDGNKFFNNKPGHTFGDEIKWLWEMETVPWPDTIENKPQPRPESYVSGNRMRVTYINHATVLLQCNGVNILTDPIWSDRAGPFSFIGTKRVRQPGVNFDDLPHIDIVLISHNHYDHLDLPTLRSIAQRDKPLVITGLGTGTLIASAGFTSVIELDWWQKYEIPASGLMFTFVPAFHNSGRGLFDGDKSLWGGFVIKGNAGTVYFAGDTAYEDFLLSIKERFPSFRLTIFPIGSYEKRWIMKMQHMNPDDAVTAHLLLNSKQSMGMHYATFTEHPEQTIDAHEKDLARAINEHSLPASSFWVLGFGEGRDVP
jgi:L-ascorbate metabolism protein UlaG (beta-lactamase superfamily)